MKLRATSTLLGLLALTAGTALAPAAQASVSVKPQASLQKLFDVYGNGGTGDRWTGGALVASVALPDGRVAYSFGSTYLGKVNKNGSRDASTKRINSSWVIQEKSGKLSNTLTGASQADFYPAPGPQTYYEPSGAVVNGNTLYQILLLKGYGDTTDTATSTIHADVATISLPSFKLEGIAHTSLLNTHTVETSDQEYPVEWGAGAVNDGGFTYVYGTEQTAFGFYAHVARVPAGQLATATPEYWSGSAWSPAALASARIFGGANFGYQHFSLTKTSAGFRVLTQGYPAGGTYHDIIAFTAASPTGPYKQQYVMTMKVPPEGLGLAFHYYPTELPSFGKGKSFVFAHLMDIGAAGRTENVKNYRPLFFQATVSG